MTFHTLSEHMMCRAVLSAEARRHYRQILFFQSLQSRSENSTQEYHRAPRWKGLPEWSSLGQALGIFLAAPIFCQQGRKKHPPSLLITALEEGAPANAADKHIFDTSWHVGTNLQNIINNSNNHTLSANTLIMHHVMYHRSLDQNA
jgi:hypothetical protein